MTQRILHIISSLAHGGTQRQMALVAAGSPRAEFDVHAVALGQSGPVAAELAQQGIETRHLGSRGALDPAAWWRLRRLLATLQPDLVHVWQGDHIDPIVGSATGSAGVPRLIVTQRQMGPTAGLVAAYFGQKLARRTRRVVASSQFIDESLRARGLPADKLALIADGVPPIAASKGFRQALLDELKVPADTRLLITVGPLTRAKRIKDLIWATDMLKFFRDDVHLLIVGDGPERARLERFRRQCEIEDKVHFLGDRSDVSRLLPHCAALLCGGGVSGPSISILEAMMAGVPAVGADTTANRELVVPEETGFLVPPGDRNQFARCAHQLTSDPALHQRLAAAARRRAMDCNRAERMVSSYVDLYRQVLADR